MGCIRLPRTLAACMLAACGWLIAGSASAQALSCTSTIANALFVSSSIDINRTVPLGQLPGSPVQPNSAARLQCTGGTPGMPLEVALRVPAGTNPRPNPFGPGVLMDSPVPGIGIVVETTAPAVLTSGFQVVIATTRSALPTQSLAAISMRVHLVKTGEINLMQDYALHGFPVLYMAWRSPGEQDTWVDVTTYEYQARTPGDLNIRTETCYLGTDAHTPLARTETLGPVAGGDFSGIGTEAPSRNVVGTIALRCRNFGGGSLSVTSPTAHATMPGVLRNALTGGGAASGVGVRIRNQLGGTEWDFLAPWPVPGFNEPLALHHFDYHARYVQTENTIAPGAFSAVVTFTVNYD